MENMQLTGSFSQHDLLLLALALRYKQAFEAGDFDRLSALFELAKGHPEREDVLCATAESLAADDIEAVRSSPEWQERLQDLIAHWREHGDTGATRAGREGVRHVEEEEPSRL